MIVFMNKVRFLGVAVHLQADFLVGVFQLRRWDQIVSLNTGEVVHGLRFSVLPPGLSVDVPQSQAHHAQQHQQSHQPHGQRNSRPLEAVFVLLRRLKGGEGFASRPGKARRTDAGRWRLAQSATSCAKAPVEARPKGTLVLDSVTVAATVARRASAHVVVDSVLAGASIKARATSAFIDVDFAALSGEARAAATHADATLEQAQTTISAGKRRALVHSLLAVESSIAAGTLAHIAAAIVFLPAFSPVEARGVIACQQAVLTVRALETLGARAHVAALQIRAEPSVPAGVAVTLLHLQLAVNPGKSRQACARIAPLARIHAGGTIHAGMVMGAEVQILVT